MMQHEKGHRFMPWPIRFGQIPFRAVGLGNKTRGLPALLGRRGNADFHVAFTKKLRAFNRSARCRLQFVRDDHSLGVRIAIGIHRLKL